MKETMLKSEIIYDGKIIQVKKDNIILENGHQSVREVVYNSGGVCTLALTEDKHIIMVKQFRYPSQEELWELPGGKREEKETFVETGLRELIEETGYVSKDASYFGYLYPTVAYCSEVIHMVVAKNCRFEKQRLDEGEHVEVRLLPIQDTLKMICNNEIKDGKTIVAILKYMAFLKM